MRSTVTVGGRTWGLILHPKGGHWFYQSGDDVMILDSGEEGPYYLDPDRRARVSFDGDDKCRIVLPLTRTPGVAADGMYTMETVAALGDMLSIPVLAARFGNLSAEAVLVNALHAHGTVGFAPEGSVR